MALNINLPPYQLNAVASKDNFFQHYSAADAEGADCTVSELFPVYMARRADDGTVGITEQFMSEFSLQVEKFTTRANAVKALNDAAFNPIVDVLEKNNTAYLVRKKCDSPPLTMFMGGQCMTFSEAYVFIKPLILFLTQSARCEVFFTFELEDMHVNRYGHLVLDKSLNMDAGFATTLTDAMKVYYFLIVGKAYDPAAPSPKEHGVNLPPRLASMVGDVLSGENRYGGVDDFAKQFKYIIDQEGDLPKDNDDGAGGKKKSGEVLRWVLAGLSLVAGVSLILLVIFVLIPAYRTARPDLTDPSLIVSTSEAPPAPEVIDYSAIATTDPSDGSNILDGSYLTAEGALFYRGYNETDGYYLAKREQNGADNPLTRGVRPAFLAAGGGFVYFADGMQNNKIIKVNASDGTSEIISENNALYLCINGDYLYYTNHSDRDRLYRVTLSTGADEPYVKATAFETVTDGESLYFINGDKNFSVYSVKDGAVGPELTRMNQEDSRGLTYAGGLIMYMGGEGYVKAMLPDGQPVELQTNLRAHSFKSAGKWIVMVEEGTYRVRAFNVDTETTTSLGGDSRAAYVWVGGGEVYATDYGDVRVTRGYTVQ